MEKDKVMTKEINLKSENNENSKIGEKKDSSVNKTIKTNSTKQNLSNSENLKSNSNKSEESTKTTNVQNKKTTVVNKTIVNANKNEKIKESLPKTNLTNKVESKNKKEVVNVNSSSKNKDLKTTNIEKKSLNKSNSIKVEEKKTDDGLSLFNKFKTTEKKLIDVLKEIPKEIPEAQGIEEKKNIKSYINKVEQARKLFDEYEELANKLTKYANENENDEKSIEISKKVIDSRLDDEPSKINEKDLLKQYQLLEKQAKGFEKVEIETMGDVVVVKKKKTIEEKQL